MTEPRSYYGDMVVEVPEGVSGNVEVRRFEVTGREIEAMRLALEGRCVRPGIYTALMRAGTLWMSDTPAERRDHYAPAALIDRLGGDVLIGGLGLGMLLRFALLTPGVQGVDVVEIDPDVIALVGPHYEAMAQQRGKRLTLHHADVMDVRFPRGQRWSVAWFDIWPERCSDNLSQMAALRRRYRHRTEWVDCWGRQGLAAEARRWAS